MLKVLTAAQMREVDRLTTEKYGIPSIILMENAASAVVNVIKDMIGSSIDQSRVLVVCGKGNNGGDGAAIVRQLRLAGVEVDAVILGLISETSGDARTNFDAAANIGELYQITNIDDWNTWFADAGNGWDVVVDALFGTGLDRPIDGWLRKVIADINAAKDEPDRLTVAVDMPSGLNADLSEPIGATIQADLTVTFTTAKPANVLPPSSRSCGELAISYIGSPLELVDRFASDLYLTSRADAAGWLAATRFTDASYKNKRGHALIIAGSKNYTGAAVLCGDAAIRSGVGLVTLAVPVGSRESVVARVSPEVMVRGIPETANGSAAIAAVGEIKGFRENVDVIAVGSGLSSKEDETRQFVRKLVEDRSTPIVIDADGLTALSPFDISGSDERPLILTPHEGEFMRLLGTYDKTVIKDRVAAVRDFAVKHHVILVLKGERVLIGEPGGKVAVSPTGNSGLGKAGNGDTLTGILCGFVAQAVQMKVDMFETVVAAVYIAGLAGDIAESKYGKRVMTASDVRECLVEVFSSLESSA